MIYYTIKHIHVTAVVLSAFGFLLRGWWMLNGSPMLQHRVTRVLPHVVDTVLLLSAMVLAVMIAQYPFVAPWITAKVAGLVAYVVLGTIALKRGRTLRVRAVALFAAMVTYAWIVSVAMTKRWSGFVPL